MSSAYRRSYNEFGESWIVLIFNVSLRPATKCFELIIRTLVNDKMSMKVDVSLLKNCNNFQ